MPRAYTIERLLHKLNVFLLSGKDDGIKMSPDGREPWTAIFDEERFRAFFDDPNMKWPILG